MIKKSRTQLADKARAMRRDNLGQNNTLQARREL